MADHHPPSTPPTAHHDAADRLAQLRDLAVERGISLSASDLPCPAARALDEDNLGHVTALLTDYITWRHTWRPVSVAGVLLRAAERGAGAADTMLVALVFYERLLSRAVDDVQHNREELGRP